MANLGNGDSISIRITSDARSANRAIDALEKHLSGLATQLDALGTKSGGLMRFSKGVTQLSNAMLNFKNSGVGTADFSRLVKNLGQLSSVDHAGIEATAESLNKMGSAMGNISLLSENASKVTEFTNAMSQLGRKGVSQAIDNLPRLTDAFRNLLLTLNETPEIRGDIIQMTQALAEFVTGAKGYANGVKVIGSSSKEAKVNIEYLAQTIQKIGVVMKKVFITIAKSPFQAFGASVKAVASGIGGTLNKIRDYSNRVEKASTATSKFAVAVGTLYVKFWLLARVLSKFWGSIKKSFDYLETVNYFNSSFESIANKAVETMGDAGKESAEAYYEEYTKTAKSLTAKLTGFVVENGNMKMTGLSNLGLDPNTTLNYQATFAQIANSMGVASDKAVILSNVLTEIGADLASVKNMDFEDVWQNMSSALVGMSRAVDKFGINIRASAMQEKLFSLGIQANVKDLSQADKALLRTIMILDSSKYAWADLADTLDTPANQIRMLTANLNKLATMFGSLFLPILKKVLPYINAVVIALQRLVQTVANALHIDLSGMLKGGGGSNDALSDILDESEELDDSLEDATEQAKKLKNNLLGIDELNIINDNQDDKLNADDLGVSGLLDEAFLDAVSEYQKAWDEAFARLQNKAQEIADKIIAWAKKVFAPIKEAWDNVGDNFLEKWKYMTGEVGKLLKSIARDWAEVWAQDNTEKIFEHIFNSLANIFEFIGNIARQFRIAWDDADRGKRILEALRDIVLKIWEHVDKMTASWAKWAGELNFKPILESILKLLEAIRDNADGILNIVDDFQEIFLQRAFTYLIEEFLPKLLDIVTKIVDGIDWEKLRTSLASIFDALERIGEVLGNGLLKLLDKLADVVIEFVNGHYFENLANDFQKLATALENAKDVNDVIDAIFDFGEGRVIDTSELINKITNAFNEAFEKIDFKNLGKRVGGLINKIFETIDWQALVKAVSNIARGFFELIHGALKEIKWFEVGQAIGNFLKGIEWGKIIKEVLSIIGDILGGLVSAWFGSLSTAPLETTILTLIGGILLGGKLVNGIVKIVTGSGIGTAILKAIFGGNGKLGEESSLFEKIFGSAKDASKSKSLFAEANGKVADSCERTLGSLPMELQFFGEAESKIAPFLKTLGGIALVGVGVGTAGYEFGKMWKDGVTVADSALAIFGVALGAIGAIILGAPATVALAVAGIVTVLGGIILVLHEHWDEITKWWNDTVIAGVTGFFDGLKEKREKYNEAVGLAWDALKEKIGEKWEALKTAFGTFIGQWGEKIHEWASQKWEAITDKVEEIRGKIEQKWGEIKENFITHIQTWQGQIQEWASAKWEDITNKVEEIRKGIEDKWTEMRENFQTHIEGWREKIGLWASEKWEAVQEKVEEVRGYIERKWGEMQQAFSDHIQYWKDSLVEWAQQKWDDITTTMDTIKQEINDRWELMKQDFDDFKEKWRTKITEWASEKWDDIVTAMQTLKDDIYRKWGEFKKDFDDFLGEWRQKIASWASEKWDTVVQTFETLRAGIGEKWEKIKTEAGTFWDNFKTDLGKWAENAGDAVKRGFDKLKDGLSGVWNNLKTSATTAFDAIKTKAENIWDSVKDTVGSIGDKLSGSSSTTTKTTTSTRTSGTTTSTRTTYSTSASRLRDKLKNASNAMGGFPEDGLFFANHGELVGKFSNGKTAVANNQQITDGIAQATYQAMMRANADSTTEELDLLRELIGAVRQGSRVVIDGREIVTAYDNRKSRNGYAFS